jgi:type VI secretion system secreted protein VgrG
MLLTTYARHGAQGSQLDREELLKLLSECGELFQSLGQTAAARGSQQVDSQGIETLRQLLTQWPAPESNSSGDPLLAVAAEAGIASATPRSQVHYAGENHDTTAQDHLQLTSGAAMRLNAGQGISAFAQDQGISAIANRGKVLVQAQDDDITLNAQKNLHLSAAEGEVVVTAPTIRLVADDGSYIKIGGGIEIGTQGRAIVHASDHDWVGPKTDSVSVPSFGRDPAAQRLAFHYPSHDDGSVRLAVEHAYQIKMEDGSTVQGLTDSSGLTERVESERMHQAQVAALRGSGPKGGNQ